MGKKNKKQKVIDRNKRIIGKKSNLNQVQNMNGIVLNDTSTYAYYPQLYMQLLDSNFSRLATLEQVRGNLETMILDPKFVHRLNDSDKLTLYRLITNDYTDTRDFTMKVWDSAQKNNLWQKMMDTQTNKDKDETIIDAPVVQSKEAQEVIEFLRGVMKEKIKNGETLDSGPIDLIEEVIENNVEE